MHSEMIFTGKNTEFKVVWDCSKQTYTVYYKGKYFITGYGFADIKSYLN